MSSSFRDHNAENATGSLSDLPPEIFLMIIQYLDPVDLVRCRRISKKWHEAFSNPHLLKATLIQHYSQARELRSLRAVGVLHQPFALGTHNEKFSWKSIFDNVVARYQALKAGTPRLTKRIQCLQGTAKGSFRYDRVGRWDQCLWPNDFRMRDVEYPDECWTYDDGLLVYPCPTTGGYVVLDVQTNGEFQVPFNVSSRVVRRIRLKNRVLIVEWAEHEPNLRINEHTDSHRHFVTAFDVSVDLVSSRNLMWVITQRSEWKLHFTSLPLTPEDRFFSAHTATHYAVYVWRKNHSTWGESSPIESLTVWDITRPWDYRPSEDPAGKLKPAGKQGPLILKSLKRSDLVFCDIKQGISPWLSHLDIDEDGGMLYVYTDTCVRLRGAEADHQEHTSKDYLERVVGIPVIGQGPIWQHEVSGYYGNTLNGDNLPTIPTQEKREKICVASPRKVTGWRYSDPVFNHRSMILERVIDEQAGLMYLVALKLLFPGLESEIRIKGPDWQTRLERTAAIEFGRVAQTAGDERFLLGQSVSKSRDIILLKFDKSEPQQLWKQRS
ncbi:hypothetical protein MMC20_006016 [Loxospora ochrophaea]|nr:hypothetical protein [Loxospora ochrophaea]